MMKSWCAALDTRCALCLTISLRPTVDAENLTEVEVNQRHMYVVKVRKGERIGPIVSSFGSSVLRKKNSIVLV